MKRKSITVLLQNYRLLILLAFIFLLMYFLAPSFFNKYNLIAILSNASINGIIAVGMTLLMISRAFDMSVGSNLVLSGAITVIGVNRFGPFVGVSLGLASGLLMGFTNGLLVARLKINSFIATLGTFVIYQGLTFSITKMTPVATENVGFSKIAGTALLGIPIVVFYFVIAILIVWVVLRFTQLGKYAYAIGGNSQACKSIGIKVERHWIIYFVISGFFASVSGVILSSKIMAASAIFGENIGLIIVAAIVLGGVSLAGGVGNVVGVVQAIIIIGVIENITVYLGMIGYWQLFFRAIVLIGVILYDVISLQQSSNRLARYELSLIKADRTELQ